MSDAVAVEARLGGPIHERAVEVARQAVTAFVYGGPATDDLLEFVLTEANNDRTLGSTLTVVLAEMAGTLAGLIVELQLGDTDLVSDLPPHQQADEMLARALAVVTDLIDGQSVQG
jgi:hypothetical protein